MITVNNLIDEYTNLDYFCGAGKNYYFIDSSGILLPCEKVNYSKYKYKIDDRYNLLYNNFYDIIDLELFNYVYNYNLKFIYGQDNSKKSFCNNCKFKFRCAGCAFYEN